MRILLLLGRFACASHKPLSPSDAWSDIKQRDTTQIEQAPLQDADDGDEETATQTRKK